MYSAVNRENRCVNCILPDSFAGITFDEDGVCNFCSSYEKIMPLGEKKLWNILSRKNGGSYDCVIQLSGGKDSTYVLYYAVKKLGLKVIAVNYDSGFQSEMAMRNMKRTCAVLNVPLVIHKADFGKRVQILKKVFNIANIVGIPIGSCANCSDGIRAASRYVARLHGVRTILSGQTDFERFPHNPITGGRYILTKLSKCNPFKVLPHLIQCGGLMAMERARLNMPAWKKGYLSGNTSNIKTVYLFDYIPWTCMQPDTIGLLAKEVGWEYPGDRADRFDCLLHPFLCYKWFYETGISWDGYLYSVLIRMGTMSRDDALTRERILVRNLQQNCHELIKLPEFNGVTLDWLRNQFNPD